MVIDRQTDRQADRQTGRQTYIFTLSHQSAPTLLLQVQTDRQIDIQTDRLVRSHTATTGIHRQTYRQTSLHTHTRPLPHCCHRLRQTDRHLYTLIPVRSHTATTGLDRRTSVNSQASFAPAVMCCSSIDRQTDWQTYFTISYQRPYNHWVQSHRQTERHLYALNSTSPLPHY
jgi:hypothetical protein